MSEIQRRAETKQLFSYHVIEAPFLSVVSRLLSSRALRHVPGLHHAECLLPMNMGHAVSSPGRYRWSSLVFFAFWESEAHLDRFLEAPPYSVFERAAWHMRMRFYRRWGSYTGLEGATKFTEHEQPEGPVAAVTLARLKLSQTLRFARVGKGVEAQVRDHPGLTRGAVAFRPLNKFSTFSVWESEEAMRDMVRGKHGEEDGTQHRDAMIERAKKPFHYEFTTMRFIPLSEHGEWPGRKRLPPP
ncbi:MAG: quinol monooxygenase YgiN [Polyangiales bacterium]|jgi:quinol monooxygenase YgiN